MEPIVKFFNDYKDILTFLFGSGVALVLLGVLFRLAKWLVPIVLGDWWAEKQYLNEVIHIAAIEVEKQYDLLMLQSEPKEKEAFLRPLENILEIVRKQILHENAKHKKIRIDFELVDGQRYALMRIAREFAERRRVSKSSAPLPIQVDLSLLEETSLEALMERVRKTLAQYKGENIRLKTRRNNYIFLVNVPPSDEQRARAMFRLVSRYLLAEYPYAHCICACWAGNAKDAWELGMDWEKHYVVGLADEDIRALLQELGLGSLWELLQEHGLIGLMRHALTFSAVVSTFRAYGGLPPISPGKLVKDAIEKLYERVAGAHEIYYDSTVLLDEKIARLSLGRRPFRMPSDVSPQEGILLGAVNITVGDQFDFLSEIVHKYFLALAISKGLTDEASGSSSPELFKKMISDPDTWDVVTVGLLAGVAANPLAHLQEILGADDAPRVLLAITFAFHMDGIDDGTISLLLSRFPSAVREAQSTPLRQKMETAVRKLRRWWPERVYQEFFEFVLSHEEQAVREGAIALLSCTSTDVLIRILWRVGSQISLTDMGRRYDKDIMKMSGAMSALAMMAAKGSREAEQTISQGTEGNWSVISEVGRVWSTYARYKQRQYEKIPSSFDTINIVRLLSQEQRVAEEAMNVLYCLDKIEGQRPYYTLLDYFDEAPSHIAKSKVVSALRQVSRHMVEPRSEEINKLIEEILRRMQGVYLGLPTFKKVEDTNVRQSIAKLVGMIGDIKDYSWLDSQDRGYAREGFIARGFSKEDLEKEIRR